jgi:hypothetical protein
VVVHHVDCGLGSADKVPANLTFCFFEISMALLKTVRVVDFILLSLSGISELKFI